MDERQIIRALRERDPQGVAAVYDRYAEGLYDYCWWLLRDHDTAREACRDALLAAGVHADALRNPRWLHPWLFALVRAECLRRGPATPRTDVGDETAPDSTELRSLAWKATEALPATESDILQLHVRHGIDSTGLATVLGRPVGDVERLVQRARARVGRALRAEMIAVTGPSHCPELASVLNEPVGEERDERVDRHARACAACSERVPRRVSVSRLMGLLPAVSPPAELRQHVIDAYADPRLLEYRLLAARRLPPLGRDGFPRSGRQLRKAARGTAAVATVGGLLAASVCAAVGLFVLRLGPFAEDARAQTGQHNRLAYEELGTRPTGYRSGADTAEGGFGGRSGGGGRWSPAGRGIDGAGTPPELDRSLASGLSSLTPFVPNSAPVAPADAPGNAQQFPGGGRSEPGGRSGPGGSSPDPSGSADDSSSPAPSTSTPSHTSSPSPTSSESSSPSPTSPDPTSSDSSPSPSDSSPSPSHSSTASQPSDSGSASPSESG